MVDTPDKPPTDHLDETLLHALRRDVSLESILLCAAYDLDTGGMYTEGYLILTQDRLGDFVRTDGHWRGTWRAIGELDEVKIVEGLGMNLLRLLGDSKTVAEYRFTLRHAKAVAALGRRMERLVTGKEGEEETPSERPGGDEKKIRCDKCGRAIPVWSEFCPACTSRRKVLSRLLDFVRPYKYRAIIGASLAVIVTFANLARPWLTKPLLNRGLGTESGYDPDYNVLMTCVGILVGLTLFAALAGAVQHRLMALLGSRIARDVRNKTYDHLHKLSLSFFSRKPTGSLVTRITSDSDRIWDFVAFTVVEAGISFLTIAGVAVALFWLNWKLACIVLIPIPIMILLMVFFHRKMHTFFHRIFHRWSQMTAVVADALPGVRVIKAFSQEDREVERFGQRNQRVYEGEVQMIALWTLFGPALRLCSQVGSVLVWIVGGYWVIRDHYNPPDGGGGMDPGTLMAFISYMWMFYGPIHMISHMDRMFNRAATSVQRIFEVLDTQPAIFSHSSARQASSLTGQIELRNVSFSYDGVRKVLKGINLKISPGQMIGLAGPSGGGKTTMVNLICRFYDVLEGQILIDGVDVRDYDVSELRRNIGVVLQEPFLFHGTVAENIAYGRPEATMDDIITSARAANAHDFIVGFPDGYDTLVGERGHTLSGGERQRISIARAILNNPHILILDEATSSVDTETEKLIQEALDRLIAKRTTIAIAHRLSTLRRAHRLVILDKGLLVEEGSHEQLAAMTDGVYAKLLRMQTETRSVMAI